MSRQSVLHEQHAMQAVHANSAAAISELEQLTARQLAATEDPVLEQILRNAGERSIESVRHLNVLAIHAIAKEAGRLHSQ